MGEDLVRRIAQGEEPLLDVATVAERLATTPRHVRLLVERGELAHIRVGRYVRIPQSALEAYVRRTMGA